MAHTTPSLLQAFHNYLTGPTPAKDWHTDTLNRKNELVVKAQGVIEGINEKQIKIMADRKSSDEGKQDQLHALITERLPQFEWLGRVMADMDANHERLRTQLFTVKSPEKNDVLRYFRALEIRDDYRDAEANERNGAFLAAAQQNDEETLAAFLDKPGKPLLTEEHTQRGLALRAQRFLPVEYDRFRQVTLLRDYLGAVRDAIALWLRACGLDPVKIHAVVGGTLESHLGTPDGAKPLNGAEWQQAIAAAEVM